MKEIASVGEEDEESDDAVTRESSRLPTKRRLRHACLPVYPIYPLGIANRVPAQRASGPSSYSHVWR